MVKFCEKIVNGKESTDPVITCGTLLLPVRTGSQTFLVCKKCGHEIPLENSGEYVEKITILHTDKDRTLVIESLEEINLPTIMNVCPKCSNNEAWYMQLQTRKADESMTTFYRCKKCSHTWRDVGD
ncbi:MAG: transcription factor S [Promethearchaeota archaeon]